MSSDRFLHTPQERWLNVANAALREVGATPLWEMGQYGPMVPVAGITRDHYRSSVIAIAAVGRTSGLGEPTADGHVVCWPCWDVGTHHDCAEVTIDQAMRFEGCGR